MVELLVRLGFYKIHECKCGGRLEFWQHPKYRAIEVDIRPERDTFEIWNGTDRAIPHIMGTADELEGWVQVLFGDER